MAIDASKLDVTKLTQSLIALIAAYKTAHEVHGNTVGSGDSFAEAQAGEAKLAAAKAMIEAIEADPDIAAAEPLSEEQYQAQLAAASSGVSIPDVAPLRSSEGEDAKAEITETEEARAEAIRATADAILQTVIAAGVLLV